jgi:CheY-like chemotaxis protein|tara:strand:- start:2629 stop:3000 length:372 start_codon:yes stop_codon:yes gene_type:complete
MKPQVLLVEDDELCQEIVAEFLAEVDVDITLATDGMQAVSAVQQKHFDIVLMDMIMPHMGGLEATSKIRSLANKKSAQVPILAITARNPATDQDLWFATGVDDFIAKPFSELQLLEAIKPYIA